MTKPVHTAHNDDTPAALLQTLGTLLQDLQPRRTSGITLGLDTRLERDLGLDSLARMELLARLERQFGVTLEERVFAEAETPRDLLRSLDSARGRREPTQAPVVRAITVGAARPVPDSATTLVEALRWHVESYPTRPHIQVLGADEGELTTLTYEQLWTAATAAAAGLQGLGVQPGQPIAIMLPTGRDYFVSFFAVLLAGAVPVPIYPPARWSQLEDHLRRHRGILSNCRASVLITVPAAKALARLLQSLVESLREVVTPEDLAGGADHYTAPAISGGDVAFLQYTSGSTGNPKGVILTHANLLANIRAMGERVQASPSDVFVSWLPLYHDMGLIGAWFGSLYFAMPLVVMSPLTFLSHPERWLRAIHRFGGTLSAAPNFAYELCLKRLGDADLQGLDLSSWRIAFNGAEPVSPNTLERFAARFAPYGFRGEALMPVYGLAESTVGLAFPPLARGPRIDRIQRESLASKGKAVTADPADPHALRFVACGMPLPGHELRVVDSSGRELPERHEGHVQFRGPSATSGYYRNPEATERLFQDGWLDTGDLGYMVAGEVYITGRSKDIILRAGRNFYPHELEEAVGGITGIRKGCVAVFGSTEPASGTERLVVLAETREQDAAELERMRREINTLAAELVGIPPDDVVLGPPHTVPKTSSGKIRRAASRERYEDGQLGQIERAVWWQITRLAVSAMWPVLRRAWRNLVALAYAGYAWAVFGLLAPLAWVLVALLPRLSWRWDVMHALARLAAVITGTRLQVRGLEHLPREDQPCILVANHASYLDGHSLVAALHRPFSFVAKAEFAQKLLYRIFMRRIRAELVERFDREKGVADAKRLAQTAREGRSLLFFPEGTFTRMPGLLSFHMGAFHAAAVAELPVVPIAIRGTRSILRAGSWFPRRGAITVTVCPPLHPKQLAAPGGDIWGLALQLRDAARAQILAHCGEPDLAHETPSALTVPQHNAGRNP
ncbi:MAG: AMP-binding protein [Sedimenticolaceae bacterium]